MKKLKILRFSGSGNLIPPRPIIVNEGDNVRMRCAADGRPKPNVEWRKYDGSPIPVGSWQGKMVEKKKIEIRHKDFLFRLIQGFFFFFFFLRVLFPQISRFLM